MGSRAGRIERTEPLGSLVTFNVDTDKRDYYEWEPVRLKITVRNDSGTPVRGYFFLRPFGWQENFEVYYRRPGEAFRLFRLHFKEDEEVDFERSWIVVAPGGEEVSEFPLLYDPTTGQYILGRLGHYEFKVVYRDPGDTTGRSALESNVVQVSVSTPPSGEDEALKDYRDADLARLVQYDRFGFGAVEHALIQSGVAFIDSHPTSLYSAHVRNGLLEDLPTTFHTEKDQRLYERLVRETGGRE
jgi:hypothetical protein